MSALGDVHSEALLDSLSHDNDHGWRHGTAGAVLSELHTRHLVARLTTSRGG